MKYYILEPEVPGHLDDNTPEKPSSEGPYAQYVDNLGIRIEGWMGDDLMTIDPCYIVTSVLRDALTVSALSGFEIDTVAVSLDKQLLMFPDMAASWPIPKLYWLKITGKAGNDDFGLSPADAPVMLVVSGQSLNLLQSFHLESCEVSEYVPRIILGS